MIVGIDLGTTNSLIAILEKEGPQLIPNGQGSFLTAPKNLNISTH